MGHRECGEEEQEEYGGAQGQGHRLLRVEADPGLVKVRDARHAVGEEAEIVEGETSGQDPGHRYVGVYILQYYIQPDTDIPAP